VSLKLEINMSNSLRKRRNNAAKRLYKLPAGEFTEIDLTKREHPRWMTRAFYNNRYVVMINDKAETDKGTAIRAMVQRHDGTPIPNHWSEMQNIKNELFGHETLAIEYYPKVSQLTDEHNIYWMWIFPEGVIPIPK
jgi:hypothetical protein